MKRVLAFTTALTLTACGGGGGTSAVPAAQTAVNSNVRVSLVIPPPASTSGVRRAYISPSTKGAQVVVTGADGTTYTTLVDLSSTSSNCSTTGGTSTCSFSVTAAVETDTFNITLYDLPPANGAFPSNAKALATQTSVQSITGSTTSLTLYLGPVVAGFGSGLPSQTSLPADGNTHTFALLLAPVDATNQPVSTGPHDPYANPITVTLTESGGSGHAQLLLNGATSATSATLSQTSDSVTLSYDGGGSPGYTMSLPISATGVVSQTVQVSPLFVTSTSTSVNGHNVALTGPRVTVPFSISEAGAASATYSAAPNAACANVATAAVSGSGAAASLNITGGSTASTGGCVIEVSDGASVVDIAATNNPPPP